MKKEVSIKDVSIQTNLSPFGIIYFLKKYNTQIDLSYESNTFKITEKNYELILSRIEEITYLEKYLAQQNINNIHYLKKELAELDLIYWVPDEYTIEQQSEYIDNHLRKENLINDELERELLIMDVKEYLEADIKGEKRNKKYDYLDPHTILLDEDESFDESELFNEGDSIDDDLLSEYKVYNGTGFITSTYDLDTAKDMARMVNGVIYDEDDNIVNF